MQTYQKRKTSNRPESSQPGQPVSKNEMLHMSGAGAPQPMSPALREKFEPGFSADFSNIRISRGHIPEEMGVQAVAQGTDILLDASAGMDVLGHELAHVVQQAQGRVDGGFPVVENAALEHEADVMGQRVASGLTAQAGPQNGFGGETMSIAPMSSASAPAQCKTKEEKEAEKAEKAAKEKQARVDQYSGMVRNHLNSDARTQQDQFDANAMSAALDEMAPKAMASVTDRTNQQREIGAASGDVFNYFREEKTNGVLDERGRYYKQLKNAGRETNINFVGSLVEDAGSMADTEHTSLKSMGAAMKDTGPTYTPEQRAKAKSDYEAALNLGATDMGTYLSLLEQNPEAMSALKESQSKVFNPMVDQGLISNKEEAATRALNELLLRSLGPDAAAARFSTGIDQTAGMKASIRVQAMMANQTDLMKSFSDPDAEMSDSARVMQQIQRDFFIRNGFMDDPSAGQAAQAPAPAPEPVPEPAPNPGPTLAPKPGQEYTTQADLPQSGQDWSHVGSWKHVAGMDGYQHVDDRMDIMPGGSDGSAFSPFYASAAPRSSANKKKKGFFARLFGR